MNNNHTWMPIQKQVQSVFVEYVSRYMDELDLGPDFPDKYAFEEFRVKRYREDRQIEFADHVDVGDYNSARRFLVCSLYLNDVEEGGTTDFPKLSHTITPKCARILVFPPTWMYRHAGRPVVKGKKYILGNLFALSSMNLEVTILSNLVYNEKYARKVLPFHSIRNTLLPENIK